VAGSCEHSNELLDSMKNGEFLDWPSDYYLMMLNLSIMKHNGCSGLNYVANFMKQESFLLTVTQVVKVLTLCGT
jgi:hypothetical protein